MYERMRCRLAHNITIPGDTELFAECVVEGGRRHPFIKPLPEQHVLVTGTQELGGYDHVNVLGSISNLEDCAITYCHIVNSSCGPIEIPAGTDVGDVVPVQSRGIHYYEYVQENNVYFLHDREAIESILTGNDERVLPDPPGYELKTMPVEKGTIIDIDSVELHGLTPEQEKRLKTILHKYKGVFSTGPGDFGCTPEMSFRIDTGDHEPVAARYHPIPVGYQEGVRELLDGMMNNGMLEHCDSPWNNNLVIVPKPDGSLRICANLKGVNKVTKNTTCYPINHQEESLIRLCNAAYFLVIDLSQAYYSIPIRDIATRNKTAITAFGVQMRFKVSPFGAKDLPSQFNKLMSQIMDGLQNNTYYYFDDLIGAYRAAEELLEGIDQILFRLYKANMRVNFKKSKFSLTQLTEFKWLGSVIHKNRLHPDSHKIDAILEMPMPKNAKGMQQFIGCVTYHARHLPYLSEAAGPLYKLQNTHKEYKVEQKHLDAFEKVKKLLTEAPALALPDIRRPFILTTDASDMGVGGCLSQIAQDTEREEVVAYASRLLSTAERNGSSCQKELIAILFGISKFSYYLLNTHFTLRTDSKSLVYLKFTTHRNSQMWKSANTLAELSFDIEHQSATRSNLMGIADMISRAYGDCKELPRLSYKGLRDPKLAAIEAPPTLPDRPVTREEFDVHAEEYLKTLEPIIGPLDVDEEETEDEVARAAHQAIQEGFNCLYASITRQKHKMGPQRETTTVYMAT